MGLASVVQNCVRIPSNLPRFSSSRPYYPSLYPVPLTRCSEWRRAPILCSNRTGQQQEDSASEGKGINAQPHDDTSPTHSSLQQSRQQHETYISSVRTVALWVGTAAAFGVGLGFNDGVGKASEFFAGYILEQSLSVDNLFVFVLVFKYFKVPMMYQNRVLSYGIAGAVFFRLTLILLGTATLQRFEAVNLLLAAILLYSSFKLFASEEDESDLSNNFVVKTCQKFIPVTTYYDGNRFITNQDGMWKVSNILGRPHLCYLL